MALGDPVEAWARTLELRVAAHVTNLDLIRTIVGAVAMFDDLDLDAVSDCRLAVDEACNRLISAAVPGAVLTFVVHRRDDALVVDVSTMCDRVDLISPDDFSWHVLRSLTDDVHVFNLGETTDWPRLVGISITTNRAAAPGRGSASGRDE